MSDDTQADIAATRGKHCNASCSDYYCSQNVSGRCQAPNKCLGVEEAAELVAELEAAKREIANLRKENAKLREALKDIGRLVEQIHFLYSDYPSEIHEIARKVNAALAEPVKNCEVGTPAEQTARFAEFCKSHIHSDLPKCAGCPLEDIPDGTGCAQAWAQLPYEKGESNGSN